MAVGAAFPASAVGDELPACQPGWGSLNEACDGGNGWRYDPPTKNPENPSTACGLIVTTRVNGPGDSTDSYQYRNCGTTTTVCVTYINPLAELQSGDGRTTIGIGPGLGSLLGGDSHLANPETRPDTIEPGSIFTREKVPGQPCAVGAGRFGAPITGAGAGVDGSNPNPPDNSTSNNDPCDDFGTAVCNADQSKPPHVTVYGQVVTTIHTGEARPLSRARYELWYKGKDGTHESTVQFRPVLDRVDASGKPTGSPVRGYLDANGSYALNFVYPQNYGSWFGCAPTNQPFLRSTACADDDLMLRIYAENPDKSVEVRNEGFFKPVELAHTSRLGFFSARNSPTDFAISAVARAYRGVYDVKDLAGGRLQAVPVTMYNRVPLGTTPPRTSYNPLTGNLSVYPDEAGWYTLQHETAHSLLHDLWGATYAAIPTNCGPHEFHKPSNEACALDEGFANFVATAATRRSDGSEPARLHLDNASQYFDLEDCSFADSVTSGNCQRGEKVEGNIAATLWDLLDNTPNESSKTGFKDTADYTFNDIVTVIDNAETKTAAAFWGAWKTAHPNDIDILFRNSLFYTGIADDEDQTSQSSGTWTSEQCSALNSECVGEGYLRSAGSPSAMTWDLRTSTLEDNNYEIWVHLPGDSDQRDPAATYTVHSPDGDVEVTLDQSVHGGWVHLPGAFELDSSAEFAATISVRGGPSGGELAADGVLVAPASVV